MFRDLEFDPIPQTPTYPTTPGHTGHDNKQFSKRLGQTTSKMCETVCQFYKEFSTTCISSENRLRQVAHHTQSYEVLFQVFWGKFH